MLNLAVYADPKIKITILFNLNYHPFSHESRELSVPGEESKVSIYFLFSAIF